MLSKVMQATVITLSVHLLIGLNTLETKVTHNAVEPSEVPGEVIVALRQAFNRL
ncbi:hypothetical protein [cf. Phormidesmis sp. LEGE 11477]|uniref:hypothetical protein n=1 Tax=cf. Phormidesmis sp. LEGE 11477 TaxID=1828680 RepID=UPI001880C27E|nr:hypothetical protein [cf. Phormidesmis sp. LEGE 11477]MBE9061629.1 hypothetical protein [cf. Phormidesmis sp. LEGE 11477]